MDAPVKPLPNERWLPVRGFVGVYAVSSMGRVFSHERVYPTGWRRGPRLLRLASTKTGYLKVDLNDLSGNRSSQQVHRLVARAFLGEPLEGQMVRHLNGLGTDNRLENLAWGTASENTYDAISHGTHPMTRRASCKRGHPYAGSNLVIDRRGRRACRTCLEARTAADRRKAAERRAQTQDPISVTSHSLEPTADGGVILTVHTTNSSGRSRMHAFHFAAPAFSAIAEALTPAD
jgi:hypothetical protein